MPEQTTLIHPPAAVLDRYRITADSVVRVDSGLINATFFATGDNNRPCVLQRLNPMFGRHTIADLDAVTRFLEASGVPTCRLLHTTDNAPCVELDGVTWRVLSRVEGRSFDTLGSPQQAEQAGRVLGEFHRIARDFPGNLNNRRPPVHEPERHIAHLRRTLDDYVGHPARAAVAPVAAAILACAGNLPAVNAHDMQLVHGDPKISNIIFTADGTTAVCLVDLDTLARAPVIYELGDALRSWCNPGGEDAPAAQLSSAFFSAACRGYQQATGGSIPVSPGDLAGATALISIELAARFCADALTESYFGWDRTRFASASEHNLCRARNQLELAEQVIANRAELDAGAHAAFGR